MPILIALLFACAPSTLPAGATCTKADACDEGLECLPFSQFTGDECEDVAESCSVPCETDDDCAELGESFLCFETCDAGKTCGATG